MPVVIPTDDLIAELRRLADGDRAPTLADLREHGQYSKEPYIDRFGSWSEACKAAGLSMGDRPSNIPTEDLLAELQRLADGDTAPTTTTMDADGAYAARTYQQRFGSWAEACEAADLTPPDPDQSVPTEELLAALQRVADELGTTPTRAQMDTHGEYAVRTYQQRFGSWARACEAAGLKPDHRGQTLSDEDLLAGLRQLADGEVAPTTTEMDAQGAYSVTPYYDRFETWAAACRAAGLVPPSERDQ